MLARILWLLGLRADTAPRVYAVRSRIGSNWCKVVILGPCRPYDAEQVLGPMRSEMDAEEFCDHENAAACHEVLYYDALRDTTGDDDDE